jgi:hypothetical protein
MVLLLRLGESTKVEIASDGTFVRIAPVSPTARAVRPAPCAAFTRTPASDETSSTPRQSIGEAVPVSLAPRRAIHLAVALLLVALAMLCAQPSRSLAKSTSSCSSSAAARAKQHVRACAGSKRSVHAHAKGKGHHAKYNTSKKKKAKAKRESTHTPAALRPATCEDGTTPARDSEGEYTCGDGADPICASGAEPLATQSGTRLLCPATSTPGTEFSEASCEDASAPERVAGNGAYGCGDGSRPACEGGSQPTLSDDGSMLVCLTHGGEASTPPGGEAEESEDEADAR